jgi:hypothetical protein
MSPSSGEDLLARQAALQDQAREVLAALDLAALAGDVGPLLVTGSFVSGLMCWRELDVMVLAGGDFSPREVMGLLARIVRRAGVTGLEYRDERGTRCVTGQVRDERYHVTLTVEHAGRDWQIDLTLWLHDLHENVARWHEELRADHRRAAPRGAWRPLADSGERSLCMRRGAVPGSCSEPPDCGADPGGSVPQIDGDGAMLASWVASEPRRPSTTRGTEGAIPTPSSMPSPICCAWARPTR